MKKNNPDGKQLSRSKSNGDNQVWKKPVLIQLDIKQTLSVGSGCPPHQHEENGICVD